MRRLLTSLLILYSFTSFTTGVSTVKLSCKSASGRTIFNAEFEDYTSLRKAELVIDGSKMSFSGVDHNKVIFDEDSKVYTLYIESEAHSNFDTLRYVELWAIPSSFKDSSTEGTTFDELYKFNAKMKARDPRNGKYETPVINLNCTLGYNNP